jgi:flavin-dependent dehydrogenase
MVVTYYPIYGCKIILKEPIMDYSSNKLILEDGSRVGVIGGGPAGSFFSYFLLDMARRIGHDIDVDLFEPRDFSLPAPRGCNMCGGIVSESLVQALAAEGINIPPAVVQRGIDSYVLHTDTGSVRIDTPLQEKRIAAMHRGLGPRDLASSKWGSFDGFLQKLAEEQGASMIREPVTEVSRSDGRMRVATKSGITAAYDLLAVAVGINSAALKLFDGLGLPYRPPPTTKTAIFEYYLGEEMVGRIFGSSMHVFLLNIARLEFAAIIPKGEYVTVCLLGDEIDGTLTEEFLNSPQVKAYLPPELIAAKSSCRCSPRISIGAAEQPYADRIVFIGDCGVTRLYKDGIGAAYRTAKAAATAAVFQGVSGESFRRHFMPVCRAIESDNKVGSITFALTREMQKRRFARRALVAMTASEQRNHRRGQHMSRVMWDVFTGSAPYKEIMIRTLHPSFIARFFWNLAASGLSLGRRPQ